MRSVLFTEDLKIQLKSIQTEGGENNPKYKDTTLEALQKVWVSLINPVKVQLKKQLLFKKYRQTCRRTSWDTYWYLIKCFTQSNPTVMVS